MAEPVIVHAFHDQRWMVWRIDALTNQRHGCCEGALRKTKRSFVMSVGFRLSLLIIELTRSNLQIQARVQ